MNKLSKKGLEEWRNGGIVGNVGNVGFVGNESFVTYCSTVFDYVNLINTNTNGELKFEDNFY